MQFLVSDWIVMWPLSSKRSSTMEKFSSCKHLHRVGILLLTFSCVYDPCKQFAQGVPLAQDEHQQLSEDNFPLHEDELKNVFIKAPRNLSIDVKSGTQAVFSWDPPDAGDYEKFEVQLSQLPSLQPYNVDEPRDVQQQPQEQQPKTFSVEDRSVSLSSFLEPGSSYQVQVFAVSKGEVSQPITGNFTTKPNPPERFVVWFRNETALLIYWQPPTGTYDLYKVGIDPPDSPTSTILVSRHEYQNGRVQPGFYDLTPGRAYNISVVTISQGQQSEPLTREYRTLPLQPVEVSVTMNEDESDNSPSGFLVEWVAPPDQAGEFDGFNVYLNRKGMNKPMQKFVPKEKPPMVLLEDPDLEPGMTYQVVVKTVSGKAYSRPTTQNVTLVLE